MSITEQEKQKLQLIIGTTSSIMSSAIAKLYLASPNPKLDRNDPNCIISSFPNLNEKQWSSTNVQGALIFIIDRVGDTFLFQIYDLETYDLRFEYELYEDMEYVSLDPSFHSFEMEDCMAGFSFSNPQVARTFFNKVKALRPSGDGSAPGNTLKRAGANTGGNEKKTGLFGGILGGKKKKEIEISAVTAVRHNNHVGVKADGTLDLSVLSPEWKGFFKQAGIRKADLQNPETARIVLQTIEQSGYSLVGNVPTKNSYQPAPEDDGFEVSAVIGNPMIPGDDTYRQNPDDQDAKPFSPDVLKEYYTPEQMQQYEDYQRQLREYDEALKAYEAQQQELAKTTALAAWEQDNKAFIKKSQAEARKSIKGNKMSPPPALPPRKETPALPPRKTPTSPKPDLPPRKGNNNVGGSSAIGSSYSSPPSSPMSNLGERKKPPVPPPMKPPALPKAPSLPTIPKGDPIKSLQRGFTNASNYTSNVSATARYTPPISPMNGGGNTSRVGPSFSNNGFGYTGRTGAAGSGPSGNGATSRPPATSVSSASTVNRPSSKMFLNALASSKNKLKKADERPVEPKSPTNAAGGGPSELFLMNNLINALADRRKHISGGDDESSDGGWSD